MIGLLIPRDVVYGSILTALVWSHEYESRGGVGNSRLMSNCQFLSTYIAIHSCPWDQILHVIALLCSVVDSYISIQEVHAKFNFLVFGSIL